MKYNNLIIISGEIHCLSGLHIGGSSQGIEIGGIDNPVIKNVLTGEPYIPGSSFKGKMRSCLEKKYGLRVKTKNNGQKEIEESKKVNPCQCGRCLICRIFGSHMNLAHNQGPTRILFRDAFFTDEARTKFNAQKEKGLPCFEEKMENIINRNTGTSNNLRTMERVPAGFSFAFEIALQIFDIDDKATMLELIKEGLKLIEESYLGGSGSRGSGRVSFLNVKIMDKSEGKTETYNVKDFENNSQFKIIVENDSNKTSGAGE